MARGRPGDGAQPLRLLSFARSRCRLARARVFACRFRSAQAREQVSARGWASSRASGMGRPQTLQLRPGPSPACSAVAIVLSPARAGAGVAPAVVVEGQSVGSAS